MSVISVLRKAIVKARKGKRKLPDDFTTSLSSEAIAAVSYDDEILTITFVSGGVYEFYDFDKSTAIGLVEAGSAGQYFNYHIKDDYEYSRIA